MKKTSILLSLCFLFFLDLSAQTVPLGMKYQAVARDHAGEVLSNKNISLKVTLYSQTNTTVQYSEIHTSTTNSLGLFSLTIGEGEKRDGRFESIPWGTENIWMQLALDETGAENFITISDSKLLAVPYAFHAATASQLTQGNGALSSDRKDGNYWSVGGNEFPLIGSTDAEEHTLGTVNTHDLVLITNNTNAMVISGTDGKVEVIGDQEVGNDLQVKNNLKVDQDADIEQNLAVHNDLNVTNATTTRFLDVRKGVELNTGGAPGENTVIYGPTRIKNTMEVNLATDLNSTLNVDGVTDLNSDLNVNNNSPSDLTGSLNVDGITDLNNEFNVNNNSPSKLTGSLNVDGVTDLNDALTVNNASPTVLTGSLKVDGLSDLNNGLNVNNSRPTNLTGTLQVAEVANFAKTLNVTGNSNLKNQVTISANVNGGDDSYAAYPLRVEGSAQGIAIKTNAGSPGNDNNFVTFFDSGENAIGRIEGEKAGEVASTPEFIFDNSIMVAEEVAALVNVGLSFSPNSCAGTGAVACPPEPSVIAIAAADLILKTANLIAYNAFIFSNLGVTYQSGSADYAEWLERENPNEQISAGDIVGVKGGKISKNTTSAEQYLVISTKPAMLGNMPMDGTEALHEKVAFMGQIPVKVRGKVNIGDYILPSGSNDGIGIAVSPQNIAANQYSQIVGIAWSGSQQDSWISIINMAIGLNANDVAKLAVEQEKKIAAMEAKFDVLEQRIQALENGTIYTPAAESIEETIPVASTATPSTAFQKTRYELVKELVPNELSDEVIEEALVYLQNEYAAQGINTESHPGLHKLFTDEAFKTKTIQKVQDNYKKSFQHLLEVEKQNN